MSDLIRLGIIENTDYYAISSSNELIITNNLNFVFGTRVLLVRGNNYPGIRYD